ncbi:hypothetical protein OEG84_17615 [Hoeflea sp. G2-23]|uniref:Secreted protein n=1 Tax=Hoeflea algicola TaxID=2983763 RepID=A0ABT3ZCD9_9HYPH|nr:hypothetical protein [Hoeflea algicola]MCY0149475.1 hypothetical protein [Hoeflea algicola]
MKHTCLAAAVALLATSAAIAPARALQPGWDAESCGWYIILGCTQSRMSAKGQLADLGGPMVGGGAGTRVLNTSDLDGFRDGFYCVADGPYVSQDDAGSVAWIEAVPDAYIKRGC